MGNFEAVYFFRVMVQGFRSKAVRKIDSDLYSFAKCFKIFATERGTRSKPCDNMSKIKGYNVVNKRKVFCF